MVEDAFGEIKGSLRARPIFHWSDERIVGHLILFFLANFCEAQMTRLLRQKAVELDSPAIDQDIISPGPLTVVEAMRELAEVRAVPVRMKGHTVWLLTDIKGNAAKLLKTIGTFIPPKMLKHLKEQTDSGKPIRKTKCSGTNQCNRLIALIMKRNFFSSVKVGHFRSVMFPDVSHTKFGIV